MEIEITIDQIRKEYVKLTGKYLNSSYIQFLISIVLVENWNIILPHLEEDKTFDEIEIGIINSLFLRKITPEIWYSVTSKLFKKITKLPTHCSGKWEDFSHIFDKEDEHTGQTFEYKAMLYLATYSSDTAKGRINFMLKMYQPSSETSSHLLKYNKDHEEKPDHDILRFLFSILFHSMNM